MESLKNIIKFIRKDEGILLNRRDESVLQNRKDESILLRLLKKREFTLIGILFLMCIALSLSTSTFAKVDNVFNVARQISLTVIIALGETLVLVSGGIDLSVGSILGLSGIVTAMAASAGLGPVASIILGLITGTLCGLLNGLIITKLKINPFIVTLGMLSIARGVVLVITKGYSITVTDEIIIGLGQGYIGPIPVPVIIMLVLVAVMAVVLNSTVLGSHLKALGGNEEASRISGINIKKNKVIVYAISGLMAAIAGVIMVGRINVGQPSAGQGGELDAVAAAIVGGTALAGGEGTIIGTLIGAALIGVMSNGMVLLNVSMYWQQIVTGVIIIGVVALDNLTHNE